MSLFEPLYNTLRIAWIIFETTWWLILPVFLFFIFRDWWLAYVQTLYRRQLTWTILEVKFSRNITRTPKAMEQIFAAASVMQPVSSFYEKWWVGKIPDSMSFEIIGYAGGVYFFIRLPTGLRNLMEASIYAQYTDAEIREANDYVDILAAVPPNREYDLFGMNFILAKEDAYPIRTYEYFEDKEDERRLDPIAAITEVMSKLKEGEMIWLQIIVAAPDDWKKRTEAKIEELVAGKPKASPTLLASTVAGMQEIFYPAEPSEKRESASKLGSMTPNQRDVLKAIEEKAAKVGLKANFRFVYIDNRERFTKANVSAVLGALSQFNTQNLNALKPDANTVTKGKWPFYASSEFAAKRKLFNAYKARAFGTKSFVMNTEELATLYHFPSLVVQAPKLQRIEAKKGEPPANLPIS